MARRLALAAARTETARPQLPLPSLRALVVAGAVAAALLVGYVAARETSLFAVRAIEVSGGSRATERAVRSELEPLLGSTLVRVDADELERRLEELPVVRSAHVDRAFPHALAVVVREEAAVAVVRDATQARLVSDTGRIMRAIPPDALRRYPRIWIAGVASLAPGETLSDGRVRLALSVLSVVPTRFPVRVTAARAPDGAVTLLLAGRRELRLGPPRAVRAKLEAAGAVLTSLSRAERAGLVYLDVTVPNRPVARIESQLESQG